MRTTWAGEAALRKNEAGPAQRQAAHSASSTTMAGGPQPDHCVNGVGVTSTGGVTLSSVTHPPDPAAVQDDADPGPDRDRVAPSFRDGVVEQLGHRRHIGADPYVAWPGGVLGQVGTGWLRGPAQTAGHRPAVWLPR